MTFEEQLKAILKEETEKIMKAHDQEVEDLANVKSGTRVFEAAHRADKWRRAAEMSEADNKRLRSKVQELSKQLSDTKKEKAGLEGWLRKAEEKARALKANPAVPIGRKA